MAEDGITLYHPKLPEGENVVTVPDENPASVLEKSGWKREVPKKYQDAETKEA